MSSTLDINHLSNVGTVKWLQTSDVLTAGRFRVLSGTGEQVLNPTLYCNRLLLFFPLGQNCWVKVFFPAEIKIKSTSKTGQDITNVRWRKGRGFQGCRLIWKSSKRLRDGRQLGRKEDFWCISEWSLVPVYSYTKRPKVERSAKISNTSMSSPFVRSRRNADLSTRLSLGLLDLSRRMWTVHKRRLCKFQSEQGTENTGCCTGYWESVWLPEGMERDRMQECQNTHTHIHTRSSISSAWLVSYRVKYWRQILTHNSYFSSSSLRSKWFVTVTWSCR